MEKDALKESVVRSLDGSSPGIFPYLPYILQDLWELGADPSTVLRLVKQHLQKKPLRILDAGCGKGAVSIRLASELDCRITGIDAMPEFIEDARAMAEKKGLSNCCNFVVGDIRKEIPRIGKYDLLIMGAVGNVLGNVLETLSFLSKALDSPGYIILDDAWLEDDSPVKYDRCLRKSDFCAQIGQAGFEIVEEVIFDKEAARESEKYMFGPMKNRAEELMEMYPEKKQLFRNYLENQEYEFQMLLTYLTAATWLLKDNKTELNTP